MDTATVAPYAETVPTLDQELALSDCDRCSASARVLITYAGGAKLTLCGHHWREHEDRLTTQGWRVAASSLDQLLTPTEP